MADKVYLMDTDYNKQTGLSENIAILIDQGYTIKFSPGPPFEFENQLIFPVMITVLDENTPIGSCTAAIMDDAMVDVFMATPERENREADVVQRGLFGDNE